MAEHKGILKAWKDDKGFGFIKPDEGGKDVFVHIRDFGNIRRKPQVGDVIFYQPLQDKDGRKRAGDVRIEGVERFRPKAQAKIKSKPAAKHRVVSSWKRGFRSLIASFTLVCIIAFAASQIIPAAGIFSSSSQQVNAADQTLQEAYRSGKSNLQVTGSGVVTRILPDDSVGNRHQMFIIRLSTGQTILISHNISIAPRIASLKKGDRVEFNGEYEWNEKGGVVHWTHLDPGGRHKSGWLKHEGRTYQ